MRYQIATFLNENSRSLNLNKLDRHTEMAVTYSIAWYMPCEWNLKQVAKYESTYARVGSRHIWSGLEYRAITTLEDFISLVCHHFLSVITHLIIFSQWWGREDER